MTVTSTPILGVPAIINGQNYTTPTILSLAQGTCNVTVASEFQLGADKYYFTQWENGSTNPSRTISSNTIQHLGNFGIYDDNQHQETVYVEDNTFISSNADPNLAIFVENPANHWIIDGNIFRVEY